MVDWIILDAKDLGAPALRRRLYVVMTLRGKLRLVCPLADLADVIKRIYPTTGTWESLFSPDGFDDCFSKPVAKRARRYLQKFCDRDGAYDLDQLPDGRPRYVAAGRPLFGLTAHTRMVWSPAVNRFLRRSELAAAMEIPCHPALSIAYGLPPLSFDYLFRSAAARLIGNGMCVPCVGSVMHWCAVFCTADVIDFPRALSYSQASYGGNVAASSYADEVSTRAVEGQVSASASSTTWKVLRDLGAALCKHSMFADLAASLRSATRAVERERELFPLPLISGDPIAAIDEVAVDEVDNARVLVWCRRRA